MTRNTEGDIGSGWRHYRPGRWRARAADGGRGGPCPYSAPMPAVDRDRLRRLLAREVEAFVAAHPRSRELHARARGSLVGGVPMPWMMMWAGGFPVVAAGARGSRIVDVDGHEYVDLCLGDTGAMGGH